MLDFGVNRDKLTRLVVFKGTKDSKKEERLKKFMKKKINK